MSVKKFYAKLRLFLFGSKHTISLYKVRNKYGLIGTCTDLTVITYPKCSKNDIVTLFKMATLRDLNNTFYKDIYYIPLANKKEQCSEALVGIELHQFIAECLQVNSVLFDMFKHYEIIETKTNTTIYKKGK